MGLSGGQQQRLCIARALAMLWLVNIVLTKLLDLGIYNIRSFVIVLYDWYDSTIAVVDTL
jgi:ABC-type arginine transport system ATPase subunit